MRHEFQPSKINSTNCAACARDFISHTAAATCEVCGKIGPCDLFGALKSPHTKLQCQSCIDAEIKSNDEIIAKSSVITHARDIDNSIRYNGDLFNAKVTAIIDLKKAIWAEEIPEMEKQAKFQAALMERYTHLKDVVFEADDTKYNALTEQRAIKQTLTDLGNSLRAEIREKIRENDASYSPIIKTSKIRAKVSPVTIKKSPMDRLVEAYALMHNISKEQAQNEIRKAKE